MKIEGLPYGACSRVAKELGVSARLVQAVARGERRNVIIEEALLKERNRHQAQRKRIQRMKNTQ